MRPTKLATPNSLSSLSNISIDFIDNKVLFRNLTPNEEFISYADEVEKVEEVKEAAESQDIVKTAGLTWNIEICTYSHGNLLTYCYLISPIKMRSL